MSGGEIKKKKLILQGSPSVCTDSRQSTSGSVPTGYSSLCSRVQYQGSAWACQGQGGLCVGAFTVIICHSNVHRAEMVPEMRV